MLRVFVFHVTTELRKDLFNSKSQVKYNAIIPENKVIFSTEGEGGKPNHSYGVDGIFLKWQHVALGSVYT